MQVPNKSSVVTALFLLLILCLCVLVPRVIGSTAVNCLVGDQFKALHTFYDSFKGDDWHWSTSGNKWNFSSPDNCPCTQSRQGLACVSVVSPPNMYNIKTINLPKYNLNGTIPSAIANFTGLQNLWIYSNAIMGTIPIEVGHIQSLLQIRFDTNHLTGSLPSNIGNLTELTSFNVCPNYLFGSLPESITQLTKMTSLSLCNNFFSGTLPESLGELTALTLLKLNHNSFTGKYMLISIDLIFLSLIYSVFSNYFRQFPGIYWEFTTVSHL
jgi:hypothetical protein